MKMNNLFQKIFKRRDIEIPPFAFLERSIYKDKYFVRTRPWNWLNEKQIYIVPASGAESEERVPMDFWQQQIFLNANGEITVAELMSVLAAQLVDNRIEVPKDFDKYMLDILELQVNNLHMVEYRDQKTSFPEPIKYRGSKPSAYLLCG